MCVRQKSRWGSSSDHKRTNRHSGEEPERVGPEFTAKGLDGTITMKMIVSQWKTSTKQNPNPNVAAATDYMRVGACITP